MDEESQSTVPENNENGIDEDEDENDDKEDNHETSFYSFDQDDENKRVYVYS